MAKNPTLFPKHVILGKVRHQPIQQGHIDASCSLFSTVNAIRYLYDLDDDACTDLIGTIYRSRSDLIDLMCNGLLWPELRSVVETAQEWCQKNSYPIEFHAPYLHGRDHFDTAHLFLVDLEIKLRSCDGIAQIGLGKKWNHWTNISRYDAENNVVSWYDSWGMRKWHVKDLTLDKQDANDGVTELCHHQTFLIRKS